ncbi:MAG: hypothetical protein VKO64_11860 [Candidatus Sericytochromatia bacterium]|nr:hypothetical protein [Candidatus Sericytochromatia bacterium]
MPTALWWFIGTLIVYLLSGSGQFMHFNYHLHQAEAFLQGRLDIGTPPSWLNELAWKDGKAHVYFGPAPSVLLVPLAAIWHLNLDLGLVSKLVGAAAVAVAHLTLRRLPLAPGVTHGLTFLYGFGTVAWWCASHGNSWVYAHLVANLFLWLSLHELAGPRRGALVSLWFCLAILSREAIVVASPAILALLLPGPGKAKRVGGAALMAALLAGCDMAFNMARFGHPLDSGYGAGNEAWGAIHGNYQHGPFSLHHLIRMLPAYIWRGPDFHAGWPPVSVTDHGLGLFWTTPAFLALLPAARLLLGRMGWLPASAVATPAPEPVVAPHAWLVPAGEGNRVHASAAAPLATDNPEPPVDPDSAARLLTWARWAWLALLPSAALYLVYFGDGWRQFGARYSLDYTPWLIVALACAWPRRLPAWTLGLGIVAAVINLWGVAWWLVHRW